MWLIGMAALYGIYLAFGGKAMFAAVLAITALLLHFQIRDIEHGTSGDFMHRWVLAFWNLFRKLWAGK